MSKKNCIPNRHKRNFGYGRSCQYVVKNTCTGIYGCGKFASRTAHRSRFMQFIKWSGVSDLRDISQDQVTSYYEVITEQVESEEISQQYAANLISSLNIVLGYLSPYKYVLQEPSVLLGRRDRKRKRAVIIDYDPVVSLSDRLRRESADDLALLVLLCRFAGLRLREALMLDFAEALKSYEKNFTFNITRGTKGGRKADRFIKPPKFLMNDIEAFAKKSGWSCLIPPDKNYLQRKNQVHRKLLPLLKNVGFKTLHDLRASYACERYKALTNQDAPISGGEPIDSQNINKLLALSNELGHNRIDVLHAYIG